MIRPDRAEVIDWANHTLKDPDWVLIDTETTGLSTRFARVAEIAIVDPNGQPLLNTLVNPGVAIPAEATRIHNITDEMVGDAPYLIDVWESVLRCVSGRKILCYNVAYDRQILGFEAERHQLEQISSEWECVMLKYAAFVGEPGFGGYKYQKLPSAGHRALDDCRATIEVIGAMAAV